MGIINMVYGEWWGWGSGYKTYNQLKDMSLSDALTELNKDAQGYYDNLNWNIRIYNNCFIWNDSNDGEYKWNWFAIIFYNWVWSSIDISSIDEESIVIIMMTDSNGDLKIPVAWCNRTSSQDAPYNWKVSYDWWSETTYSWTGSASAIAIWSWLVANTTHIVVIKPVVEDYGWALAFWFRLSWVQDLLQSVVYDWSYKWYWVSSTYVWDQFRARQYYWCTSLTKAPEEVLPSSVTNIGTYFRYYQYYWCTSLTTAPEEVLPSSVTTIGNHFRERQHNWCTSLTKAPEEALPSSVTNIGSSFRAYQYYWCSILNEIKWWIDLSRGNNSYYRREQFYNCNTNKIVKVLSNVWFASYNSNTLENSYVTQVKVPNAYLQNFIDATTLPRSWITDSKFIWY